MDAQKRAHRSSHETFVTYAQLAVIGLITFGILLILALILPGSA